MEILGFVLARVLAVVRGDENKSHLLPKMTPIIRYTKRLMQWFRLPESKGSSSTSSTSSPPSCSLAGCLLTANDPQRPCKTGAILITREKTADNNNQKAIAEMPVTWHLGPNSAPSFVWGGRFKVTFDSRYNATQAGGRDPRSDIIVRNLGSKESKLFLEQAKAELISRELIQPKAPRRFHTHRKENLLVKRIKADPLWSLLPRLQLPVIFPPEPKPRESPLPTTLETRAIFPHFPSLHSDPRGRVACICVRDTKWAWF